MSQPSLAKPRGAASALTIAGSDSGGEAGIQADLKTFAALSVHGACAVTAITAQNARRILAIEPCSVGIVRSQLEAVFEHYAPRAVKTGMLYSSACVQAVVGFLKHGCQVPLVVDPVMIATSGRRLLSPGAMRSLTRDLLPIATLVTPNIAEAEVLVGRRVSEPEDLRAAGRELHERFGCAALVKGGHLSGMREALDFFYDGKEEFILTAPFFPGQRLHGTGCTLSAAITAGLAHGFPLVEAVTRAKRYVTRLIARAAGAGSKDSAS